MRNAPYRLLHVDEETVPAAARLNLPTTFCAERPDGTIRFDERRVGRMSPANNVEWLWPNRIPVKQVILIEGAPGAGKSFVALDIVARATRGLPWVDHPGPGHPGTVAPGPVDVLFIGQQDDEGTISRRLEGLGADLQRIRHFRNFFTYDPEVERHDYRPLELPVDWPAIEKELEEHNELGMIVIDPLSDFCNGPQQLAEALHRLSDLASRMYVSIIVTLPVQTRFDSQGALKVTSRWRTERARCVWTIAADPDDPARRLFISRRMNFCQEPHGLAFRLVEGQVVWDPGLSIDPADPLGRRAAIDACLKESLRDGPARAPDVFRLGSQRGFNPKQLRSAGERQGIESHKAPGYGHDGGWVWYTREQRAAANAGESAARHEQAGITNPSVEKPGEPTGKPSRETSRDPDTAAGPAKAMSLEERLADAAEKAGDDLIAAVAKNEESLADFREIWDAGSIAPARADRGNRPSAARSANAADQRPKPVQHPR
jgi:hypothetical protein